MLCETVGRKTLPFHDHLWRVTNQWTFFFFLHMKSCGKPIVDLLIKACGKTRVDVLIKTCGKTRVDLLIKVCGKNHG